jgi:hypothetical protein
MSGTPTASFAAAVPGGGTPPPNGRSPHPSAAPKAGPFRQANMFLPTSSKLVPVISVVILLLVVLIPCAAVAVTRYRRLR